MRLTFFHLLVLLVLGIVRGHDGDDDHGSSHLWLEEPQALAAKYEEAFMDHAEALFGIPSYGEEITARLIYATPGANAEGCDVYPDATTETWRSQANDEEFILLIDRGTCNFVKKVRNAEEAGASAVLIADSQCLNGDPYGYCDDYGKPTGGTSTSTPGTCANGNAAHALGCTGAESALPFMANDGSGDNIRIPSYLVSAYNAQNLKSALCSKSDKSSCSVAADYTSFVMVTMEWDVPSTDGHVDWEIWTSSEDWYGAEFKREFARVARELEESTDFTPHYYHYDGLESGCMDATSGENVCVSNCINSGRYCSITPHGENIDSVTGADVVKENLRQMCVWKVSKAASKEYQWWDYIVDYADQCFGEEGVENSESLEQCSTQVMQENGITYADVQSCITGSGGYDVNGGANTMLQADLEMKKQLMILELPTIIVNGATLRLSPSYGPVLTAICAAYTDGTEPLICDKVLDPSGNNDGKWILQANVLIEFQTSSFTVDEFNWQLQSEFRSQMAFKAGVDKAAVSLDRITQYNANSIKAHVYFHELTDDELDTAKRIATREIFARESISARNASRRGSRCNS
eukprot:g5510.t1